MKTKMKYVKGFLAYMIVWVLGCAIMGCLIKCEDNSWVMAWGIVVHELAKLVSSYFER